MSRHSYELEDDMVTGINITPLVDVCLVLVIIFLVATPLLSQPAFEVNLPEADAKSAEGREEDKVAVSIGADGRLAIAGKEYRTLRRMKRPLSIAIADSEEGLVVISADRDALHGMLTSVMALAKAAGAKSIRIATEKPK